MDKVHLALAVLSIAMVVGPIVGVVSLIGEKNAELMLPP
jgi:hypothetical protein